MESEGGEEDVGGEGDAVGDQELQGIVEYHLSIDISAFYDSLQK